MSFAAISGPIIRRIEGTGESSAKDGWRWSLGTKRGVIE